MIALKDKVLKIFCACSAGNIRIVILIFDVYQFDFKQYTILILNFYWGFIRIKNVLNRQNEARISKKTFGDSSAW